MIIGAQYKKAESYEKSYIQRSNSGEGKKNNVYIYRAFLIKSEILCRLIYFQVSFIMLYYISITNNIEI